MFIYTLDNIPWNWYTQLELQQETFDWESLTENFITTFIFQDEDVMVQPTLQLIQENFFEQFEQPEESLHDWSMFSKRTLKCYKIDKYQQDDDQPREVNIPETKGERAAERLGINPDYTKPLKTRKVNIGIQEVPNFSSIEDYWHEETVEKVTDLLHEYQDLFPTKLNKMKGIVIELGEMKIPLKPDVKPMKQHPYHLNPRYKEKVKV